MNGLMTTVDPTTGIATVLFMDGRRSTEQLRRFYDLRKLHREIKRLQSLTTITADDIAAGVLDNFHIDDIQTLIQQRAFDPGLSDLISDHLKRRIISGSIDHEPNSEDPPSEGG